MITNKFDANQLCMHLIFVTCAQSIIFPHYCMTQNHSNVVGGRDTYRTWFCYVQLLIFASPGGIHVLLTYHSTMQLASIIAFMFAANAVLSTIKYVYRIIIACLNAFVSRHAGENALHVQCMLMMCINSTQV